MSFLNGLLNNDSMKKRLLGSLVDLMKENNWEKLVVYVDSKNEIAFQPLDAGKEIIVDRELFEFYKTAYINNQSNNYGK